MTAVVLKLYCREEPSASFDAAPEGTVDRLEDHDVVICICKSADGIGDSQDDARQLDDLQHRLNEQRDSLDELSEKLLSEAHNASMQLRKQAEEESSEILRSARSAAAQTEKEAVDQAALLIQRAQEDSSSFWQDVSSLLQKKLDAMEDG